MRTIVVTGSASGIGKASADLLLQQGHRVIGVDLQNADINADLSTEEGRAQMVQEVEGATGGSLDAVLACAGIAHPIAKTVSVNYFGAIATLEGLRPMLERGTDPRAAVISSLAATFDALDSIVETCLQGDESAALAAAQAAVDAGGGQEQMIYSSTKRAVARWVRRNAIKPAWAGQGILLNTIGPGLIQTNMTQALIDDPQMMQMMQMMSEMMPQPTGRHGQAQEVARLLVFLISPENSHLVGQMIYIDGGSEASTRGEMMY